MTRVADLRRPIGGLVLLSLLAALLTGLTASPAQAGANYQQPKSGQCRYLSAAQARAKSNSSTPVSCTATHTSQTVTVGRLSAIVWKSKKKSNSAIASKCQKAFNKAVGRSQAARLKSAFAVRAFSPTKAQRKKGARWFRCDVVLLRGTALTPMKTTTKPLLSSPAPANQALCWTSSGSATTCDAAHSYKATHVFKLKGKKYPGKKKVNKAARKGCKARVSTTSFRYDAPSKKQWLAGKKHVVCFSADNAPLIRISTPQSLRPTQDLVIAGTVTDQDPVRSIRVQLRRDSDGYYLQDNLSFSATVNDLPITTTGLGTRSARFSFNAGRRSVNNYSIGVIARDAVGNLADAFSIVSVSNVAPTPGQLNYQMNEPSGATTMIDSSSSGLDGSINQAGLDTGVAFSGATGYNWPFRNPTAPPASPERIVQVADNSLLDARSDTFSIEIRYRTSNSFGNIIQKGQSASLGGQWKIQAPGGKPSCLFKSSPGTTQQIAIQSTRDLSDNQWHTVRCLRAGNNVKIYVDGALNGQKTAPSSKIIGNIDNTLPLTIGGKLNCNNVKVGCDYFSGQIDYVKLQHS